MGFPVGESWKNCLYHDKIQTWKMTNLRNKVQVLIQNLLSFFLLPYHNFLFQYLYCEQVARIKFNVQYKENYSFIKTLKSTCIKYMQIRMIQIRHLYLVCQFIYTLVTWVNFILTNYFRSCHFPFSFLNCIVSKPLRW